MAPKGSVIEKKKRAAESIRPAPGEPGGKTKPGSRAERLDELRRMEARFSKRGIAIRRAKRIGRVFSWIFVVQTAAGVKRIVDFALSLALLLVLSPLLVALGAVARATTGRVLRRERKAGRYMIEFELLSFSFPRGSSVESWMRRARLVRLPQLLNVLRGDVAFVGPRITSARNIDARERAARKRMNTRPGLLCLWWLRKRGNIDFEDEWNVDGEYVDNQTFKGDMGIVMRAVPAMLLGDGVETAEETIHVLGLRIDNMTMTESIDLLVERMKERRRTRLCFVNADCGNISFRNNHYRRSLLDADLVLADGIGFKLAGKILRRDIRQNVNGTDLFPRLLEKMGREGLSLYLLGGKPGIPDGVADYIQENHPNVDVKGWRHGYFDENEEATLIDEIRAAAPDLLLVAFGAPRQDLWVDQNLDSAGAIVAGGVGGLFDYYSGQMPRAPIWMREIGLEWLYRLGREPGRLWKRYLIGNGLFVIRVLRERARGNERRPAVV